MTPYTYYQMTLKGHLDPSNDPGSSLAIGAHRLMLSRGVYDDLSLAPDPLIKSRIEELVLSLMAGSIELFKFLPHPGFPKFLSVAVAQTNLPPWLACRGVQVTIERQLVNSATPMAITVLNRFQCITWYGQTVLEVFAGIYFDRKAYFDGKVDVRLTSSPDHQADWHWNRLRLIIRDMASVADIGDLSPRGRRTTLVAGIQGWVTEVRVEFAASWMATRRWSWKRNLRECVKRWLENILEAGHNLKAYGEAEMLEFHHQDLGSPLWAWPPRTQDTRGSSEGPYRWKGFKYGPSPEDWDLIWELAPAVEEFVADFWAWVENPLLAVPGAWVDDDEEDY